jgi:hypothetical protein
MRSVGDPITFASAPVTPGYPASDHASCKLAAALRLSPTRPGLIGRVLDRLRHH